MTELNLVTYNVRGLNTPGKKYKVNKELHYYGANVACLQETHITHSSGSRLSSRLFPMWFYGDSTSSRSRGVAIGFDRNTKSVCGKGATGRHGGKTTHYKGKIIQYGMYLGKYLLPK